MSSVQHVVVIHFFTGYLYTITHLTTVGYKNKDGTVTMQLSKIRRQYLLGWFVMDVISSIPFDTIEVAMSLQVNPVLKLNKIMRILRLGKILGHLKESKTVVKWMQRFQIDPSAWRLVQLTLGVLMSWHYIGCLWWFIGTESGRTQAERLQVLGKIDVDISYSFGLEYLASFYWAIFMTTGLNCDIGPRDIPVLVVYECFVCFFGICLQAHMLRAPDRACRLP